MAFLGIGKKKYSWEDQDSRLFESQGLLSIKNEVVSKDSDKKNAKKPQENADFFEKPDEKSRKIIFSENSEILNKNENFPKEERIENRKIPYSDGMEMKLIRILNDIDDINKRMEEIKLETFSKLDSLEMKVMNIASLIEKIPSEAVKELGSIKKAQPEAYEEMKNTITTAVKSHTLDAIDFEILKIIKDAKKINSRDLLATALFRRVCSKNTLYLRLKRLDDLGMVEKKRENHEVFYNLTEKAEKETEYAEKETEKEQKNDENAVTAQVGQKSVIKREEEKPKIEAELPKLTWQEVPNPLSENTTEQKKEETEKKPITAIQPVG